MSKVFAINGPLPRRNWASLGKAIDSTAGAVVTPPVADVEEVARPGRSATPTIQWCRGGGGGGGGRGAAAGGGGGGGGRGNPGRRWQQCPDLLARQHDVVRIRAEQQRLYGDGGEEERHRSGFSKDGEKDQAASPAVDLAEGCSRTRLSRIRRRISRTQLRAQQPARVNAVWAPDSKAFYIQRTDSRKVGDLWLIHSLTPGRPTLETYKYAMPGEENVPQREVWLWQRRREAASGTGSQEMARSAVLRFPLGRADEAPFDETRPPSAASRIHRARSASQTDRSRH